MAERNNQQEIQRLKLKLNTTIQTKDEEVQELNTTIENKEKEIHRVLALLCKYEIPAAELVHKKELKVLYYNRENNTEPQVVFYVSKHARILVKDMLVEISRILAEDDKPLKPLRLVQVVSHRITKIIDDDMSADIIQNASVKNAVSGQDESIIQVAHFHKEPRSTFGVPFVFKISRTSFKLKMNQKDRAKVRVTFVQQGRAHFIKKEDEETLVKPENNLTSFSGGFQARPWIGIEHLNKAPKRPRYSTQGKSVNINY